MAKDLEMGYLLDFYGEVLTEKQREMLRQYYNDDLSLSEIGENFGITRQGARDAITALPPASAAMSMRMATRSPSRMLQRPCSM